MQEFNSLVLTQDFPPIMGGVSVYVENLFKNWLGRATILAPLCNESSKEVFMPNIVVKRIPMDMRRGSFIAYFKRQLSIYKESRKVINKEKIYVVQCTHIASGLAALIIKKIHSVPYILYSYGSEISGQPGVVRRNLMRAILRNAMYIVTMSNFTKQAIIKYGVNEKKIRFLVGVDIERFSRIGDIEATKKKYGINGSPIILTIARLMEHKGIDTVIKSVKEIVHNYPKLLYLVIGEGPYRENLESLIKRLNLEKNVKLLGSIPNEKLQDETEAFYSICDLFLMISRNINNIEAEGFGLVFLEAGLSKKAVVGGDSGGIRDAVVDGVTGKLVDPNNSAKVSECILSLLENRSVTDEMGVNGYKRAIKLFDWKINVKNWEKELKDILFA
jgi:phosphatidylinositol alpha-1,6-mannosyltransferase